MCIRLKMRHLMSFSWFLFQCFIKEMKGNHGTSSFRDPWMLSSTAKAVSLLSMLGKTLASWPSSIMHPGKFHWCISYPRSPYPTLAAPGNLGGPQGHIKGPPNAKIWSIHPVSLLKQPPGKTLHFPRKTIVYREIRVISVVMYSVLFRS